MKILIVDDSELIRAITIEALREMGIKEIIERRNGQEALDYLTYNSVDLVIIDLNMPVMGGLECIKKFRETDKDTPVLICSASTNKNLVMQEDDLGIFGYLAKPYTMEELRKKIDYIKRDKNGNNS